MKRNTRKRSYARPDTAEKKKQLEHDKDKLKRKKCRERNTNSESCKNCSMTVICSRESTEAWLLSKKDSENKML